MSWASPFAPLADKTLVLSYDQTLFFYRQPSLLPGREATRHINVLTETMRGKDTGCNG